jgi:hypothetical protein
MGWEGCVESMGIKTFIQNLLRKSGKNKSLGENVRGVGFWTGFISPRIGSVVNTIR